MGSADPGTRRQPGRRDLGDDGLAGPAPDPGQTQPDRPRAQRRPGGVHRRRARDRLAAAAAAAVRQRQGAAGTAGQSRRCRPGAQARDSRHRGPLARRRSRGRQSAHPDRPAQHRRRRHRAERTAAAAGSGQRGAVREAAGRLQPALAAGDGPLGREGRAAQGHGGGVAAQGLRLSVRLAGPEGSRRARRQARRRTDGLAPAGGAGDAQGAAGADGDPRRLPGRAAV
jgi:hypothetical protein